MAEKKIEVVIDGKEFVSTATDRAGGSLDGFMSKVPGWAKVTGLLTAAFAVVSKVVGEVGDFVMDSISAYDAYAAAQVKLTATSKLTGVSLDELKRVTKTARDEFGLSAVSAVELTSSVARFTTAAGATSKASGLMASALELGAASGLNATQVAEGLTSALAGNDEFLNKLGLSNPSVIWEKYRVSNGLAKDQMDDTTKALAVMTEIMNAGSVVAGGYAERLESGAGQQEKLNNRMDEAMVAFGAAIQPLRVFTVQGLTVLVDVLGRVGLAVGRVVNAVGVLLVGSFQIARGVVGGLVEGLGKLTGNKELEEWGAKQTQAFPTFIDQLKKMEQGIDATGAATTKAGTKLKDNTKLTEEEIKKQDAAWKQYLKDYEAGLKRINDAHDAYLKLLPRLQPALQQAMQTQHIEGQNRALEASKVAADAAFKAMKDGATPLPALIKRSEDAVNDMGGKLSDAAGYVLDVAEEFGGLDEEAKTVLTSVQSIGASVQDMMKGGLTFAGVAGILGAVGSIVNALTAGSRERKILELESQARLRDNTTQMQALTRQMGQLNMDVSGATVAGVENVIEDIMQYPGLADSKDPFAREQILFNLLNNKGISKADFFDLMKKFGLDVLDKNGNIDWKQLPLILATLKGTNTAAPGNDFSSRLDILKSGFAVNNTSEIGQIGELIGLGGSFSDTLKGVFDPTDIAGSRERLKNLFNDVASGKLTEAQLGGLTGNQFLSLITDIIGRIDNLSPSTGPGSTGTGSVGSGVSGAGGAPTGGGTVTSGGTVVPVKTLADVLDGVVAQTTKLGAYHVEHLNIATAHLNEARTQTAILMDIADNTRGFKTGAVVDLLDIGLEEQRTLEAAERGQGASY